MSAAPGASGNVYKSGSRHQKATGRAKRFPTTWSHPRLPFLLTGFGWVVAVMKERKKHCPELLTGNMDSSGVDARGRMYSLSTVVLERLASFFHYLTLGPHFIMVH